MRGIIRRIVRWAYQEEIGLLEEEIKGLKGRLETAHSRMREMYWEERAKEAAYGLIALILDELRRVDPGNEKIKMIESSERAYS